MTIFAPQKSTLKNKEMVYISNLFQIDLDRQWDGENFYANKIISFQTSQHHQFLQKRTTIKINIYTKSREKLKIKGGGGRQKVTG